MLLSRRCRLRRRYTTPKTVAQMRASPPRTPPIIPPRFVGGPEDDSGSTGTEAVGCCCDGELAVLGWGVGVIVREGVDSVVEVLVASVEAVEAAPVEVIVIDVAVGAARRVSVVGHWPQAMYENV